MTIMPRPQRHAVADDHRTTVLITGFGPFPGVPANATMQLLPRLARAASKLFPDVRFAVEVLPTEWEVGLRRLQLLLDETRPDLALHFGVSSRARGFEIEQRARNACAATPDAAGALPTSHALLLSGPDHLPASLPVRHIVARLRRLRIPAFVSRDAGSYLCNAALYRSLMRAKNSPGCRVGFVHIPATLVQPGGLNRGRCGACPLSWEQTLLGALEILDVCLARPAVMRKARGNIAAV